MDEAYPGWIAEIDLDSLDMRLSNRDVHFQSTGIDIFDSITAANMLTNESWDDKLMAWAADHGLLFNDDRASDLSAWAEMTDLWRAEIRLRRERLQ
jgi:hypothetical protein